ncbi:MerR family transcriptional regulator [Devosia sp. 63-57]|uniref:MerR family transcriptional regulator n=1 Tax=Devosia sp. 63-57 TaxID=1895751 RepID=UPI00086AA061|nr:MerR family transcriptional regulator [Devosia sp. 63-57]ODT48036.1 MAG: hypothetical protein ABS74_17775 [Pelagibacterium sp. SCN 63-126]ODU85561.1 MAG: hypothetical protein ABT14_12265 [Pelagibacterium sp. SCN 63-17]OJX42256.1 MAG: hypothetical protein BGO80_12075 [Devosia sp. 63-57]
MGKDTEEWLTAQQCATRTGLSIRALRLYEQRGLISPRRTTKDWRLYGRSEIERLHEIVALKAFGLSLKDIGALLSGQVTDLGRALDTQRHALEARLRQAETGLRAIDVLRQRFDKGESISTEDLLGLIHTMEGAPETEAATGWARYEQARPRVATSLSHNQMADLEGAWQFADGLVVRTKLVEGKLHFCPPGQPAYRLWAEAPDRFFIKGLPVQVSFTRKEGAVVGLNHHQDGGVETAAPIDSASAELAEATLVQRIAEQQPLAASAAAIRGVIATHGAADPDFDNLAPALKRLAEEQRDHMAAVLASLGSLQSLDFTRVSDTGLDIFIANFAQGRLEIGIGFSPSGKISTLYFK